MRVHVSGLSWWGKLPSALEACEETGCKDAVNVGGRQPGKCFPDRDPLNVVLPPNESYKKPDHREVEEKKDRQPQSPHLSACCRSATLGLSPFSAPDQPSFQHPRTEIVDTKSLRPDRCRLKKNAQPKVVS